MNDHAAAVTAVNHVEPVPRRICAFLAGEKVLDTTGALYVWVALLPPVLHPRPGRAP